MDKSILVSQTTTAETSGPPLSRLSSYGRRLTNDKPAPPPGNIQRPNLRYDFQYGLPSVREFPHEVWQRLLNRRIRNASLRSFRYGPPEGYAPLRDAIADYLRRARGVHCTSDQLVILNGSQQALDLATRLLLDPGERVVIEEPHYQGARKIFLAAGAQLVPAMVDNEGLNPFDLPKSVRNCKLIYVTPSHQFPTGAMMPASRRLALLAWARENGACILEDDYDGEYRYDGWPVPAIQGLDPSGPVLYIGTFSQSLFPSIRIGYLVLPKPLAQHFTAAKWLADRQTPTLEQEILADFISEGHFERHLRRARTRYAKRRSILLKELEESAGKHLEISGASAGMHVLVWLKNVSPSQLNTLIERAVQKGIGLYSISPYYLNPPKRAGLLLGYASLTEDAIRNGIRIFAKLL
jgi:GntR family transcriptional regulator/MocR family aminotransferase